MTEVGQPRSKSFYVLGSFFLVFLAFIYGPTIVIFVLSFQGPNGGMSFRMVGFRPCGSSNCCPEPAGIGDIPSAFTRSLEQRRSLRSHRGDLRVGRHGLSSSLSWSRIVVLHCRPEPRHAEPVRRLRYCPRLQGAWLENRAGYLRARRPAHLDLAVRPDDHLRDQRPADRPDDTKKVATDLGGEWLAAVPRHNPADHPAGRHWARPVRLHPVLRRVRPFLADGWNGEYLAARNLGDDDRGHIPGPDSRSAR